MSGAAVEAFAASWIEIYKTHQSHLRHGCRSLCGFVDWNHDRPWPYPKGSSRSLCGFVDWNLSTCDISRQGWCRSLCGFVDWNKTPCVQKYYNICRSLCGFVDWNFRSGCYGNPESLVEAYAASWIEIPRLCHFRSLFPVEAYAASWIEINMIKASGARRSLSNLMQFHGLN